MSSPTSLIWAATNSLCLPIPLGLREEVMMKASECKCCECGKQAVAFYPVFDPDIPSYPYCRACLDKMKMELAMKIWGADSEMLAIAKEVINEQRNRNESESNQDR